MSLSQECQKTVKNQRPRCRCCGRVLPKRIKPKRQSKWTPEKKGLTYCLSPNKSLLIKKNLDPEKSTYVVYEMYDPRDGRPFWVGSGVNKKIVSKAFHSNSTTHTDNIASVREHGHEPEVRIVSGHPDKRSAELAKMARCNEIGCPYKGPSVERIESLGARRIHSRNSRKQTP